ncbi:hypothetical protein IWQ61_007054 [Dispira simplex]|nr:hypothetical protein IWQ61_007054 [Dispira simplex]
MSNSPAGQSVTVSPVTFRCPNPEARQGSHLSRSGTSPSQGLRSPRALLPSAPLRASLSLDPHTVEGIIHSPRLEASSQDDRSVPDSYRRSLSRATFEYNSDSSSELDLGEFQMDAFGALLPPEENHDGADRGASMRSTTSMSSHRSNGASTPSIFKVDSMFNDSDMESDYSFGAYSSRRRGMPPGFINPTSNYPAYKIDQMRAELAKQGYGKGWARNDEPLRKMKPPLPEDSKDKTQSSKDKPGKAPRRSLPTQSAGFREQEARIKSLQHDNFDLRIQLFNLREKLNKCSPDGLEELEEGIREYSEAYQKLRTENDQLIEERKKHMAEIEKLQYAIDHPSPCTLEHGISKDQEEMLNRALGDCQSMRQQLDQLKEENESLGKQNQELTASRATLLNQNSDLYSDLSIAKSELDLAKSEMDTVLDKFHRTTAEFDQVNDNLIRYEGQAQSLKAEISYYKEQLQMLHELNDALKHRVQSLEESRSSLKALDDPDRGAADLHHATAFSRMGGSRLTPPHSACESPFPRINRRASGLSSVHGAAYSSDTVRNPSDVPSEEAEPLAGSTGLISPTRTRGASYLVTPTHSNYHGNPRSASRATPLQGRSSRMSFTQHPTGEFGRPRGMTDTLAFSSTEDWAHVRATLEANVEKLQFELRDARQLNLDKSKRITDLESQLSLTMRSLKEEDLGHRKRLEALQEKVLKYSHEKTVLTEENESLRQRYEDCQRRVEELDESHRDLQITLSRAQSEVELKNQLLADRNCKVSNGQTGSLSSSTAVVTPGKRGSVRDGEISCGSPKSSGAGTQVLETLQMKQMELHHEQDRVALLQEIISTHKVELQSLRKQNSNYGRMIRQLMDQIEECTELRSTVEQALTCLSLSPRSSRTL